MKRQIIEIDETKCNGCGRCVPGCKEGALQIIDGKARLVSEVYCDGLGACLGECPQGALKVVEREAPGFDDKAVDEHLRRIGRPPMAGHGHPPAAEPGHGHAGGGCPGSALRNLAPATAAGERQGPAGRTFGSPPPSKLSHWPVQLMLVPPHAPFLQGADLVLCADCVPFAVPDLHTRYLVGRAVLVACPKLDDAAYYAEKMAAIFQQARPRKVTILRMEVPCCGGLTHLVREARAAAGVDTPLEVHVIGIQGGIVSQEPVD
ncbi:MAG: 4Fe-4S binding protein [Candidatus Riflebacteria bacterium]|nr:4Fe-4S binding protein [Candidatus Riflebacteria bacterium]